MTSFRRQLDPGIICSAGWAIPAHLLHCPQTLPSTIRYQATRVQKPEQGGLIRMKRRDPGGILASETILTAPPTSHTARATHTKLKSQLPAPLKTYLLSYLRSDKTQQGWFVKPLWLLM